MGLIPMPSALWLFFFMTRPRPIFCTQNSVWREGDSLVIFGFENPNHVFLMAETLYRKYRPQTFADVAEQEHVTKTIQNQIASGSLAHAYLFSGPRGVGKTTIARLLAKSVNCVGRKAWESEPCNACNHCVAFAEGRFLDAVEIDAASNTGVDNVRENVIENVRFVPQQGKFKVFVIDEVHMLSTSAFNALLKTLEEPPSHAMFIFATTELHKIPATIISRCQRFDFHRIPANEMVVRLTRLAKSEGVEVDDDVLRTIAKLSEGCLRDAESLLGQVLSLGGEKITAELAASILPVTTMTLVRELMTALQTKDIQTTLQKLNAFMTDGGSVKHLHDEMIEDVRDSLMAALAGTTSAFDAATARRLLDLLLTARGRHTLSALPQLPLELALVEFVTSPNPSINGGVTPNAPPPSIPPAPVASPAPRPSSPGIMGPRPAEPAPKPSVSPLAAAAPSSSSPLAALTFTLAEIQDKWERCCEHVSDRNIALPLVLRAGKPTAVEGNVVTVSFTYGFHADACKDVKNLRLLEDAIASVMMERAIVATQVLPPKKEDSVEAFAEAFGGSVVG